MSGLIWLLVEASRKYILPVFSHTKIPLRVSAVLIVQQYHCHTAGFHARSNFFFPLIFFILFVNLSLLAKLLIHPFFYRNLCVETPSQVYSWFCVLFGFIISCSRDLPQQLTWHRNERPITKATQKNPKNIQPQKIIIILCGFSFPGFDIIRYCKADIHRSYMCWKRSL